MAFNRRPFCADLFLPVLQTELASSPNAWQQRYLSLPYRCFLLFNDGLPRFA